MAIGTRLFIFFFGTLVGTDANGNRYYTLPPQGKKRSVLYKNTPEATMVPPGWYGWLHYTTDSVPSKEDMSYTWEKPHQPNRTGTSTAYLPRGHMMKDGERPKATGDYQAWDPQMPNNN